MRGNQIRMALVPMALAAGLSACASNGVTPGYVTGPSSASASSSSYGSGYTSTGQGGRVVSVNEVALRGAGGGSTNGMMSGGLIGAAGGTAIGAVASHSIGGALVGAVLGAVGGAIAGNIVQGQGGAGTGRGIEVTVQKDDGQTVRIAQRDDGDIQLGDRVQILQDRNGVAKVVHDNTRAPDNNPPPPDQYNSQYNNQPNSGQYNSGQYNNQYGGPPPWDMQSSNQRYVPRGPDYPPQQDDRGYGPPPSDDGSARYSQARSAPRPQDDPRYGNLD